MSFILSLISAPDRPALDPAFLAETAAMIGAETRILARNLSAAEFSLGNCDEAEIRRRVRALAASRPLDINVLPEKGRRKRLLVADMDSTMIEQECVDELADLVGIKPAIAAITERAMRGEIAFEPALRERVALLAGLPVARIEELLRDRITLMAGGEALVATMRRNGAHTALVSGGFTSFTGPVAARLGFDEHHGNLLDLDHDLDGDTLSGTVAEPILGREAKRATLIELAARLDLDAGDALAVGDGANDLAMIGAAGLGVAFRAKPAVAEQAQARIEHGDLTALLYLQGYGEDEFAYSTGTRR